MEFERTLFRVHERFLSLGGVKKSSDILFKVIITLPLFIYGNIKYLNQSACLKPELDSKYILDHDDKINLTNMTQTMNKRVIKPYHLLKFRIGDLTKKDLNLSNPEELTASFEFSGSAQVLDMDTKIREAHNFSEHNVTIDVTCYSGSIIDEVALYFLNYENVVINELIVSFPGFSRYIKNVQTSEPWGFADSTIKELQTSENVLMHLISRFFGILKLLIGVFLVSNITAIYNKMTIICAPIFILAAYRLCSNPGQRQADRMNIYRAFPWIGMYLYTLNNNGRKKDRYIIFAFLCMIVIFYCLYLAALVFWTLLLFNKSFPKGLDESFYGIIALLEFLVLLFVRTRTTIKFLPKMSLLIMLTFLYYVQYTPYGFYNMGLLLMSLAVIALLLYFLNTFEIPATDWNPSYHYTPSAESPRTLYSPIFSMSWYHDLPQLWTMFYPMYGRSHFTNTELSMVNGNYSLLVQTLDNAQQRNRGNGLGLGNDNNNANNQNNVEFPLQNLDNEATNVNSEEANDANRSMANRNLLGNAGQQNLLANADADYALDISDDRNNNNRGNNWRGANENTGSNYRRIDDAV